MQSFPDGHMVYSNSASGRGPFLLSVQKEGCDFLEGMTGACMNGQRVTVGWVFGVAGSRFPLIPDQHYNRFTKVSVAAQVANDVIMNDYIKFLKPSQTSQYFGCLSTSVEDCLYDELQETPS